MITTPTPTPELLAERLDVDHEPVLSGSRWALCSRCGYRTVTDDSGVVRHAMPRIAADAAAELAARLDDGWTWPHDTECAHCGSLAMYRPGETAPGNRHRALVCVGCRQTRRGAEVERARFVLLGARSTLAELGYLDGHPAAEAIRDALAHLHDERVGS